MDILEHGSCVDVQENSGILRIFEIPFKFRSMSHRHSGTQKLSDIQEQSGTDLYSGTLKLHFKFRNTDIQEQSVAVK